MTPEFMVAYTLLKIWRSTFHKSKYVRVNNPLSPLVQFPSVEKAGESWKNKVRVHLVDEVVMLKTPNQRERPVQ